MAQPIGSLAFRILRTNVAPTLQAHVATALVMCCGPIVRRRSQLMTRTLASSSLIHGFPRLIAHIDSSLTLLNPNPGSILYQVTYNPSANTSNELPTVTMIQ